MDLTAALKAGQLAAAATHTDIVKIERVGDEEYTDPNTGVVTFPKDTIYEGRGKIQATGASVNTPSAGGHEFTFESMNLHIPLGVGPVQIGDSALIVSSPGNPARVGHIFRVTGLIEKTHATAQRLKVERHTA